MEGDTRYFYRRFMDDVIVLAKTRWHLRKAVRTVNQHFHQLKVEQAPDKTFIGEISKGWDFLGYHFDGKRLTVAAKTVEKHVLHYRQLYEQLRNKKATSDEMASALGLYVKRWQRWIKAGIGVPVASPEGLPLHDAWDRGLLPMALYSFRNCKQNRDGRSLLLKCHNTSECRL
jgi:hypothetical protein